MLLLVAPNSLVRRTIGIVAQNAWCKLEKFRSRITLAKSCSHVGIQTNCFVTKRFAGDVWQKVAFVRAGGGLDKAYFRCVQTQDSHSCWGNTMFCANCAIGYVRS